MPGHRICSRARTISLCSIHRKLLLIAFGSLLLWSMLGPHPLPTVNASASDTSSAPLQNPDVVCARCHASIYASYERTRMARGSGAAIDALIPGSFHQDSSDVTYRIYARDGSAWMSFSRPADSAAGPLQGERELLYFVGSGIQGRTYLYKQGDQWFELPVNFFGRRHSWGMAPAYDLSTTMPAALPVDANCLHCHATQVETTLPEARNRFPQRPFDQGGIGCSACHGDPTQHIAAQGHGPILNPAKFSIAARDSACIQCHLEGNATVYKPGKSLAQFRPGDTLSDLVVYFVRADQADGGRRASSQYEALLQSACKRASGDKLTCTTCHDPHSDPGPAERIAFFRARCLGCHTSPALATSHHPEQPDCSICHMPRRATTDISHEQETDHNIQLYPLELRSISNTQPRSEDLIPVGNSPVTNRDLGLAYAQLARKGDRLSAQRALNLLRSAELSGASDEELHVTLGFLEQQAGDLTVARKEYAAALRLNPYEPSALTNRAVIDASSGDLTEAIRLLDRLVQADPSQTQAGLDLAFLECRIGEFEQKRQTANKLLQINPDSPELRAFLATGTLGGRSCRTSAITR